MALACAVPAGAAAMAGAACAAGYARDGQVITVAAGGNLQKALDAAAPGDTIVLPAGAAFTGSFVLPAKTGDAAITIRSSAIASLPDGIRVSPAAAASMPKIVAGRAGQPAIRTAPGAHHYTLAGLEIAPASGVSVFDLVALGDGRETSAARVPHDLVIDRCYLHGLPGEPLKRLVALNSAGTTVEHSYLSDAKAEGQDSQAIAGWNGPGPFQILDNYLEGAGENVIFGGANPSIPHLIPSDIEVRGNHLAKPVAWRQAPWAVKNLFELKSARRVRVDGNVLEDNWLQAQVGFAVLYNCVDDSGWARVEDVAFTDNIVAHSGSGANVAGDNPAIGCEMSNLVFRNNLWIDIDGRTWGGNGRLFQVLNGPPGVVIDHNTGQQSGTLLTLGGRAGASLVLTNNAALHNDYGIIGDGFGVGRPSLDHYAPGSQVERNAIIALPPGASAAMYPAGNLFPASLAAAGFVDPAGGDFSLTPSSPLRRAGVGGADVGVDMTVLREHTRGAVAPGDRR